MSCEKYFVLSYTCGYADRLLSYHLEVSKLSLRLDVFALAIAQLALIERRARKSTLGVLHW